MDWEAIKAVVLLALMASIVNAIGRLFYDAVNEGGRKVLGRRLREERRMREEVKKAGGLWANVVYHPYPEQVKSGTANGGSGLAGERKEVKGGTEN